MKSKFALLITVLFIVFTSISPAHYLASNEEHCCPEYYVQAPFTADEFQPCNAYRYFTVGVGPVIFIPNIGVGYRERYAQLGWDTGISFSTIGYVHQLNAHLVGHYYMSPLQVPSAYFGLGITGSRIFTNNNNDDGSFRKGVGTLSPDFVFGKELAKDAHGLQFIEMHVAVPTYWKESRYKECIYFPLMYVKYGMSF